MNNPPWVAPIIITNSDGAALTNTVTATSILPSQALGALPRNYLAIGTRLKIEAFGRISTLVTAPGTLTFSLRNAAGVIFATSDALALNIVAKTNVAWGLEWWLTCRAIGGTTTANFMHNGWWESEAVIGSPLLSAGGVGFLPLQASAPVVGAGFNSSTTELSIDLFATWSVASASNSILCHQFNAVAAG